MSYVLHVWETPVPESFAQAYAAALDQGQDCVGQNPGFIVLSGRLRARFPGSGAALENGVWSDEPLDGMTDERAWTLGIRAGHATVVPYVVEQANRLGLCVFDMQQGKAWLPGGAVLEAPAHGSEGLPVEALQPDDHLTEFELHTALRRLLRKVFAPLGYVLDPDPNEPVCELVIPGGWIYVGVGTYDYAPTFKFSFFFQIRHDQAASIAAIFRDVPPDARAKSISAHVNLEDFQDWKGGRQVVVEGGRQLQIELDKVEAFLCERVLPFLESAKSLEDLERFVNSEPQERPWSRVDSFASDITLAWMAGNPKWEAIAAARIAAVHVQYPEARMNLERLLAYLRTVSPANIGELPRSRREGIPELIASYDGTQRKEFACASTGIWGTPEFADGNANFRNAVIIEILGGAAASVPLLRDLFCEEVQYRQGKQDMRRLVVHGLAMALLAKGGADELALLVSSLPAPHIRDWEGEKQKIDPLAAQALSATCLQRARSAEHAAFAEAYQALGEVLAAGARA